MSWEFIETVLHLFFLILQRDFNLTRTQIGMYTMAIHLVTSFSGIFTGQLIDIKGSKWGMMFGIFFVGIVLILHSIAPNILLILF